MEEVVKTRKNNILKKIESLKKKISDENYIKLLNALEYARTLPDCDELESIIDKIKNNINLLEENIKEINIFIKNKKKGAKYLTSKINSVPT